MSRTGQPPRTLAGTNPSATVEPTAPLRSALPPLTSLMITVPSVAPTFIVLVPQVPLPE
jgi:hypothetical protein